MSFKQMNKFMQRVVPSPGLNTPRGNNIVTVAPLALFTNHLPAAHLRTYVKRRPVTKQPVSNNCLLRMLPKAFAPTQKFKLRNQHSFAKAKASCAKRFGTMQVRTLV